MVNDPGFMVLGNKRSPHPTTRESEQMRADKCAVCEPHELQANPSTLRSPAAMQKALACGESSQRLLKIFAIIPFLLDKVKAKLWRPGCHGLAALDPIALRPTLSDGLPLADISLQISPCTHKSVQV